MEQPEVLATSATNEDVSRDRMAVCIYCRRPAIYRDREMNRCLCAAHARIEVVGSGERKKPPVEVQVRQATGDDIARVVELAQYFWGEDEFECFERNYLIQKLPAFVACAEDTVVGVLSYSEEPERIVLVVINVLPQWQGIGAGRILVAALAAEAKRKGIARIVVATANDVLVGEDHALGVEGKPAAATDLPDHTALVVGRAGFCMDGHDRPGQRCGQVTEVVLE